MLEQFKQYVSNYDLKNKKIKLKFEHSIRVMELSNKYAKKLNFTEKEIRLATLIGLLHDYGRFEQLKLYDSFDDKKTIDHADFSVVQLFDKNEIKKYWDEESDYELIKFAIKNHNKLKIENCHNEKYLKFAQLIRDTDKIDILNVYITEKFLNLQPTNEPITQKVKESFLKHQSINYEDIKNKNDRLLITLSFTFNIYNKICYEELEKYYKLLQEKCCNDIIKPYYDIIFEYIKGEKIC